MIESSGVVICWGWLPCSSTEAGESPIEEATFEKPQWVGVNLVADSQGGEYGVDALQKDSSVKDRLTYAWLKAVFVKWRGKTICLIVLIFCVRFALFELHLQTTKALITYKPDGTVGLLRGTPGMTLAAWRRWKRREEADKAATQAAAQAAAPARQQEARALSAKFDA